MAYTEDKKDECFDWIISNIKEGKSLRWCLDTNGMPCRRTFYKWLEEKDDKGELTSDAKNKVEQYTCAMENREELIFDQIFDIADDQEGDTYKHPTTGEECTNHNVIQRSKVRIEARMWALARMNAKKYGNRTDITTDGNPLPSTTIPLVLQDGRTYEDLKNDLKPE